MINAAARSAPAVARNRDPILDVLRTRLPASGVVLEIASGTGEHAAWIARALPGITWYPTDRNPDALASIAAWREAADLANLRPPTALDICDPGSQPIESADAIVCINMIHIAPWAATEALMKLAGRLLPAAGMLYLYGPFREAGRHTAPSNAAFDADLQARNPAWGVRDLGEVEAVASRHGLALRERLPMPANNLSLVFRKASHRTADS